MYKYTASDFWFLMVEMNYKPERALTPQIERSI